MTLLKSSHFCLFVADQDEALAFYTDTLGMEKRADVPFGDMRWLTVGLPDQPDLEIVLIDADVRPDIAADVRDLMARGGMNGMIFQVADCRATYAELSAKGVEFIGEPEDRFYGVDVGFRDPFGNSFRMTQPAENVVLPTS
jgi:catechol 2,3-dioxygenase-like lactoylglutathione lyase family enzyme